MKARDETITDLLEIIDDMTVTVEDLVSEETDFILVQPILESLREEITSLYES